MTRTLRLLPIAPALLLLLSCSDPVAPASEGAWVVTFSSTATQGKACGISTHNSNVGGVTATRIDALEKDTIRGANVFCRVGVNGGGFKIEGYNELGTSALQVVVDELKAGVKAGSGSPGKIAYRSAQTAATYTSPDATPCEFYFVGDSQEVAEGRVWMTFNCPIVEDVGGNSSCGIQQGTIAFQNCSQ